MFGISIFRLAIDAWLVSAFLAGLKRSTGLTPAIHRIPNKDLRQVARAYLELGEYSFDLVQVFFGRSNLFTRDLGPGSAGL